MKDVTEKGWIRRQLTEIASISSGNSISAKDRAQKYSAAKVVGRHFISTKDVSFDGNIIHRTDVAIPSEDQSNFKLAPKGSTLVCSEGGSAGRKVGLLKEDVHYGNKLFAITSDDKVLPEMVYYFCQTDDFIEQFQDRKTGLIGGVSLSKFKTIAMPLPPLEEQQRIVAVLDEAFEGLARARAHAEANLQNSRELFESLRFAMLSERTEGWETHRLGLCFRLKSGENLTAKDMVPGPFPVYGGNGIAGTHHKSNLSGDNVIIGRVGALCGNARYIDHDIWLTDNAFKVVNYNFPFDHRFLAYLLNFKNLRSLARQAAQPVISNSSLADLVLTFPASVVLQAELASKLAAAETELEDIQTKYEAKIQDLDNLRQSLLKKAFAGELT